MSVVSRVSYVVDYPSIVETEAANLELPSNWVLESMDADEETGSVVFATFLINGIPSKTESKFVLDNLVKIGAICLNKTIH